MIFDTPPPERGPARARVADAYRTDETAIVETLLDAATLDATQQKRVDARTRAFVEAVRKRPAEGGVEAFMQEYELSSHEGIVLMCLAEALLRVPDAETIDKLIEDKITSADWGRHLGHSDSLFVNASTWGFMLTGSLLAAKDSTEHDLRSVLAGLLARTGEPIIRQAISQSMRILGRQFIMGETIKDGMRRARAFEKQGYRLSYDMLGEAARTNRDAEKFFTAYETAIKALAGAGARDPIDGPGLSVKLSALDPRYEYAQHARTMETVLPRLKALARQAKAANIGLTVDAEEADRLDISLDLFAAVAGDPDLKGWNGLGLALQAYQKRAYYVVDWLADLARRTERRLMVRLVKGAYWDTEIKRSQQEGFAGYPVFTRKASTDVSYIACARKLLADTDAFYPQFATHNAHTAAVVLELAGNNRAFEFQRLHGMGEALYDEITAQDQVGVPCRIYAPCGGHKELLPYLVRRLLENGANTSFVNRIIDEDVPVEQIARDPIAETRAASPKPHPRIPLPRDIYGPHRPNSRGLDLTDGPALAALDAAMAAHANGDWLARPLVAGRAAARDGQPVFDPADRRRRIGTLVEADDSEVEAALAAGAKAAPDWSATSVDERAACLERAADLMEAEMAPLMAVATREAGKTLLDGIAEVREAVDFCRYYADQARRRFDGTVAAPGRDGVLLRAAGRGVFVCISPWNFPLAIFTGQVAAALVAGNAVIAKPAEQTPIMAAHAVDIFHRAGIPPTVLHLLTGQGETVGARLVGDDRVAGVAFTGGTDTARLIRRALARRGRAPAPLIAETGGQNAMVVDSTALPEQAIGDILRSAFGSTGQRCSALRVLFVQEDVADGIIDMLAGSMSELVVGDPAYLRTDIGPVIDEDSRDVLERHARRMDKEAKLIQISPLQPETEHGTFFAPRAVEIDSIARVEREVFGPVLHVVRFAASRLDSVIDAINGTGYGLTFGVHSRIDATADYLHERIKAGNVYVNRNMIGAVVGVQPFGGERLSGTGPKAGGPHYVRRFGRLVAEARADRVGAESPPDAGAVGAWTTSPVVGGRRAAGAIVTTHAPGRPDRITGTVALTTAELAEQAMAAATVAAVRWAETPVDARVRPLETVARRLATDAKDLAAILSASLGLGRKAADRAVDDAAAALRAFAGAARDELSAPLTLRGYTGERDELSFHGRGPFLCRVGAVADLAAAAGMIAATLAAGNPAVTIADARLAHAVGRVVSWLLEAGVPADVLHFLPVGDDDATLPLYADARIAGVAMVGDTASSIAIDATLAERDGPIVPLIVDLVDQPGQAGFDDVSVLAEFVTERTLSVDTTASGGNASLFSMDEEEAA